MHNLQNQHIYQIASFVQKHGSIPESAPAWPVDEISTFIESCPASEPAPVIPDIILMLHLTERCVWYITFHSIIRDLC